MSSFIARQTRKAACGAYDAPEKGGWKGNALDRGTSAPGASQQIRQPQYGCATQQRPAATQQKSLQSMERMQKIGGADDRNLGGVSAIFN